MAGDYGIRIMPDYTVPTGLVAEVGQSLATLRFREGFTFDDASQEAWTQAGYYRYTVTYTPEDTDPGILRFQIFV